MSDNPKAEAAFRSLSLMLGSIPLSPASSASPASFLLHDPNVSAQITSHLRQPDSGAGDNDLCRWLYDTFQSSDPALQLVVLRFLPVVGGVYLSRASLRKSLAGFEAVLLAVYAHETAARKGQPMIVSVPDLSHPSIYHEATMNNTCTELNLAFLSQSLEPYGTIRSTKRARIVGVALELYYSKISQMPVSSKIEFCEFCVIWAGQDEHRTKHQQQENNVGNDVVSEGNPQNQNNDDDGNNADKDASGGGAGSVQNKAVVAAEVEKEGRIPLPWELLQPVLRILSHCLLGPTSSKELREAAHAASRSLYARALHDVDPRATLAAGSLLRLGKVAVDSTLVADPTEIRDFNNPVLTV